MVPVYGHFSDAVNNDIQVVKNADSCLIYDLPFSKTGLLWSHLISWWAAKSGCAVADIETERALYRRLFDSLQLSAEKLLFKSYFATLRSRLSDRLPALVPQVYLHYDPYTARQLRGEKRLPRQRMDFLLLLSSCERIVIEVDGSQHYSDEDRPAPEKYADMVSADRDLRLAGYEVYRFGGFELLREDGEAVASTFFARLFAKHNIRGSGGLDSNP
jgi:very-short-patch-repair endonuclease